MGWPVHRLGRLLRLEGASLDGPRRRKHNHNRRLHHRSAIAVPRALGDSLDCPGISGKNYKRGRSGNRADVVVITRSRGAGRNRTMAGLFGEPGHHP